MAGQMVMSKGPASPQYIAGPQNIEGRSGCRILLPDRQPTGDFGRRHTVHSSFPGSDQVRQFATYVYTLDYAK
jgi:hypothetical protein